LHDTVVNLLPPRALEVTVLRETDPQTTIRELLLPEKVQHLPAELAQVDAYLDDERFVAPGGGCSTGGWADRRCRSSRCCGCCT
jgi:hypothetical protein